jgi:hypothetical protein
MNRPHPIRSVLAGFCGLMASVVSAEDAELVTRDLFVSFDAQPTDFSFTADSAIGTRSGDDSFDSGFGISVGGRWSFTRPGSSLGLVIGGDLDVTSYRYENDAENLTGGVRLIVGAGWAITDHWELLLEPTVEYGLGTFEFPGTQAYSAYEADGTLFGYGLRLNLIHRFSDRWAVMGAIGWKRIDNDLSGDGIDLTLEQEGMSVSIGLLYRLSAAPARVE